MYKDNQHNRNQKLRIIPLGGVSDVTKNMYVYEYDDDIVVVDCGVGFPDEAMPGVDLVIPDIDYLRDRKHKVKAILITHGHEDHIGSLPFIWPELQVPIYTGKLTAGFIRAKFSEHNLPKNKIFEVKLSDTLNLGVFKVSFYQVSHSVPDSRGIVFETPVGTIVHQADFKIDWTPVSGQVTDVGTVATLGAKKIKLLLIDCLRIEKPGFNRSERFIGSTFEKAARETKSKLLITTTSSNVSRMQQAIDVAVKVGRKVAILGRSFEQNFQVARDLGYLDVPPGLVVASDAIKTYQPNKLLLLIAGAQGQPGSSLSRAANGEHKQIRLEEGDSVVFSADPIPSTESAQSALIDSLVRLGVEVYYSAITSDIHVSGHAAADELKLFVNLAKPDYMMPIGGTPRHVRLFANTFCEMGYKKEQILQAEDGDIIVVDRGGVRMEGRVEVDNVFVDGLGVGDVGDIVLRDRQVMSEEGVVVVVVPLDQQTGQLGADPDLISRGFVFEKISEELLAQAKEIVVNTIKSHQSRVSDWRYMRKLIEDNLGQFFYKETERRPMILSIVVEV